MFGFNPTDLLQFHELGALIIFMLLFMGGMWKLMNKMIDRSFKPMDQIVATLGKINDSLAKLESRLIAVEKTIEDCHEKKQGQRN